MHLKLFSYYLIHLKIFLHISSTVTQRIRADFRFSNCYLIIILSLSSFVINKEIISYRKSIIIPYNNLVIHLCFSVFSCSLSFLVCVFFRVCVYFDLFRSLSLVCLEINRVDSLIFLSKPSRRLLYTLMQAKSGIELDRTIYIYYISTICTNKLSIVLDAFALV